jgi:hypothetical protein
MRRNSLQAAIAALVRDPGVIVGVPILLMVALNVWEEKQRADEVRITAEAHNVGAAGSAQGLTLNGHLTHTRSREGLGEGL